MKLTIYDIAKKGNVSIATVSRVLNPETRIKVSPKALARIDAIIQKFHYVPSLAARGLIRSRYNTIGIVAAHGEGFFLNEYYSRILCGVADFLLDSHYRFKLLMLKCSDERKWDKYNFNSAEGVDGLIIIHWHLFFPDKLVFKRLGIPCVIIGDPEKGIHAHCVSADQFAGGRLAGEYLWGGGHRRIAVMTGGTHSIDSHLRLAGFKNALAQREIELDPNLILCGEFQEEKAGAAFEDFLKKKMKFSAIFCLNDTMAYGVIKKMREFGLRCPDDISVLGFDDNQGASIFNPPLTTIRIPLYEAAKEATRKLVHFLEGKNRSDFFGRQTLLPVSVIPRQSVRPLNSGRAGRRNSNKSMQVAYIV